MSGLINKVKEALHSDKPNETGTHSGTHNTTGYNDPEGVHGPHGNRMTNAADPRVDSDRDHRGAPGVGASGAGVPGAGVPGAGVGHTGYNTHAGHNTHDQFNTHTGHNTHPHAGGVGGVGGAGGAGMTGYNDPAGTHGPHGSRMANAADPRFDSDRDHRGAPGAAGTAHYGSGPGPAPNTAGPHGKDMMNKVDPRVDSDLDGSKTMGGNKTYAGDHMSHGAHRDPRDAAQAPPSVVREHVGEPTIEHGGRY